MPDNDLFPEMDTPSVLVDMDALEANINEMSQLAAEAGLKLRPHIKIHESPAIAQMQIKAGAIGVEVGSVDQVEAVADGGISDILIAHPFWGEHKVDTLKRILKRKDLVITCVIDMLEHAQAISSVAHSLGMKVPVVIKIETGANRLGVLSPNRVLTLARQLRKLPGIDFKGIYAHEFYSGPTQEGASEEAYRVAELTMQTAKILSKEGFALQHVSVGASPTFRAACQLIKEGKFREINEIHPGKLVLDDIAQAMMLDSKGLRRAVSVLSTVISTSHPSHAVIDAGFKTFGYDALFGYRDRPDYFWQGKPRYGIVKNRPNLWFGALHAEVGRVFYKDEAEKLSLGERIEILPNNTTLVIHIMKKLYGVRKGKVERLITSIG